MKFILMGPARVAGLLTFSALWVTALGCAYGGYHTSTTAQIAYRSGGPSLMVIEDDYYYYPGYEIYYSRNRHEYVYRDGANWVRRPQPPGITVEVLMAAPTVRMDFRDSPERHHDTVIRSYPKNWKGSAAKQSSKDDKKKGPKEDHKEK